MAFSLATRWTYVGRFEKRLIFRPCSRSILTESLGMETDVGDVSQQLLHPGVHLGLRSIAQMTVSSVSGCYLLIRAIGVVDLRG